MVVVEQAHLTLIPSHIPQNTAEAEEAGLAVLLLAQVLYLEPEAAAAVATIVRVRRLLKGVEPGEHIRLQRAVLLVLQPLLPLTRRTQPRASLDAAMAVVAEVVPVVVPQAARAEMAECLVAAAAEVVDLLLVLAEQAAQVAKAR